MIKASNFRRPLLEDLTGALFGGEVVLTADKDDRLERIDGSRGH
jgi:hypothetical protein